MKALVLLALVACIDRRDPPPVTYDMKLDVDATLVGLSTAITRLNNEVHNLRELQRHLAICLDASYDLQTVHECGRRYRYDEKGWAAEMGWGSDAGTEPPPQP